MKQITSIIIFLFALNSLQAQTKKVTSQKNEEKELLIVGQSTKAKLTTEKYQKEDTYKIERRVMKDGRVILYRRKRIDAEPPLKKD